MTGVQTCALPIFVTKFVAINGDVKYPYCERMNMSTSPGLPYKKMKSGKGKAAFFTKDDDGNYTVSDLHLRTLETPPETHWISLKQQNGFVKTCHMFRFRVVFLTFRFRLGEMIR